MITEYELLKDTPTLKAGAIFEWDSHADMYVYKKESEDKFEYVSYRKDAVEGNTSWFLPLHDMDAAKKQTRKRLTNNIVYLRRVKGLTQNQLARFCGKAGKTTVAAWENQRSIPMPEMLPILSDLFGVTVDDLLRKDLTRE